MLCGNELQMEGITFLIYLNLLTCDHDFLHDQFLFLGTIALNLAVHLSQIMENEERKNSKKIFRFGKIA